MIWQNMWAWLGLLVLALPLLIHLLARRHARVQPFPTLRFLPASPLLPTRRSRLSDPLLLMVRLAILAAAVAGLAQPLLLTAHRQRDTGRGLARAIVLDTSASMMRPARGGEAAIQAARRTARRLAGAATTSVILESPAPARLLAGAVGWLALQPGQHELVVVSDFQIGTIEQPDLLSVPAGIGVLLERVDVQPSRVPLQSVARHGDAETVARITLGPDRTDVEWTTRPVMVQSDSSAVLLLTGAAERVAAQAARRAAQTIAGASLKSDRAVAIVYPRYDQRAQLLRDARPLNRPWLADALLALRSDSTLQAV
ncbi:MAG TPA: BatA domain-containing protein, partial [Longimicrobiales bacterium]|nr:BatA domain-containing protein [Longimicrobiales bacterium]